LEFAILKRATLFVRAVGVVARALRSPADAWLMIHMGLFIARLPEKVQRSNVASFFREIETAPRPRAQTIDQSFQRIARLREACLSMPRLWRRNTCYIRAYTLLRFLDPGEHRVRIHFGVEQSQSKSDRLRGHAWVSVDGRTFEAPDAVFQGRIHEVPIDAVI
jgi:hypothetical protein